MPSILTFVEVKDGRIRRASLEALSEAARLAPAMGATVESALIGDVTDALIAEVGSYGAARVHVFEDAALKSYSTETYARALAKVISETQPAAVLMAFTAIGKDLAPRVAAKIGCGLASD